MSRVHYLSFYVAPGRQRRASVPAGFAKIEYIADVLVDAGWDVRLVSAALAVGGYEPRDLDRPSPRLDVVYLPSWRPSGRIGYAVAIAILWAQIARYLLIEVKPGETVLAYHSLAYLRPIQFARRLKPFRLVLEFNDLYHAVSPRHASWKSAEEAFIRAADAHLFMNQLAAGRYGGDQPHVISSGSYAVPERRQQPPGDGRTHVVYAGIIEPGRRAAELAVRAAEHLDETFALHVLGFGAASHVAALKELVAEVNDRTNREAVTFHGVLRGREFNDFLHQCHIGVSSHAYRPDEAESADFTFPSKIPQYAAHGLQVVSPAIACVVTSPFAKVTSFYDEHDPRAIAKAVRTATKALHGAEQDPAQLVAELDTAFRQDLLRVIS